MSEENKTIELIDEELEKVSGGSNYSIDNHKPIGYAFRTLPSVSVVYKIYEIARYLGDSRGYEYYVDTYYNGINMGHYQFGFSDDAIDMFVNLYGLPE